MSEILSATAFAVSMADSVMFAQVENITVTNNALVISSDETGEVVGASLGISFAVWQTQNDLQIGAHVAIGNSRFANNEGLAAGGVVVINTAEEALRDISIHRCKFLRNNLSGQGNFGLFAKPPSGGAILISRIDFAATLGQNSHVHSFHDNNIEIVDCIFADNIAGQGGALAYIVRGRTQSTFVKLKRCQFLYNEAIGATSGNGGALLFDDNSDRVQRYFQFFFSLFFPLFCAVSDI